MSRPGDEVVAALQREQILPHCPRCRRPCCALTDVVLDLSFSDVRALYRIGSSQKDFDRALPPMIRKQNGRYYAHGAPCPAFDVDTHHCGVYGTRAKPRGCDDFPIYQDDGAITVDLRCEAARDALPVLRARVKEELGDVVEEADADFPDVFVRLRPRRRSRGRHR